jgi:hypothetical protein
LIQNDDDVLSPVMAGLVPAISASTGGATDGRDKPGHDDVAAAEAGAAAEV